MSIRGCILQMEGLSAMLSLSGHISLSWFDMACDFT